MLSDSELIETFVQQSIQRQEVLLANPALTARRVFSSNQLTTKTEGLLLAINLLEENLQFRVKSGSVYWEAINQALVSQHFLLKGEIDRQGFYQYRAIKLPQGYQANCTHAVLLWRAWWRYQQQIIRGGIPLELLIRTRDTWYPIRNVECGRGLIYIQTFGSEIQLCSDDLVVWLNRITGNPNNFSDRLRTNVHLRRVG